MKSNVKCAQLLDNFRKKAYPAPPGWLVGKKDAGMYDEDVFDDKNNENYDEKNDVVAATGDAILQRVDQLLQEIDLEEQAYGVNP